MKTHQEILKNIGWPTEVLILDFESYYDSDYSLSKMSTIEYITDDQFELTGLGYQFLEDEQVQFLPPDLIDDFLQMIKKKQNDIVICVKNAKFDITILAVKFGIIPPYIIDIDDLLRHYDSRMSHRMKDVTKMFGLKPKGKTVQFKGLSYEDMDGETKTALAEYCTNDIEIEKSLFTILIPKITNPNVEIPVARHTLNLYLRPRFRFDFAKAKKLKATMLLTLLEAMKKVEWVHDYEN